MRSSARSRSTKTSAARNTSVTAIDESDGVTDSARARGLSPHPKAGRPEPPTVPAVLAVPPALPSYEQIEDSDVFLKPQAPSAPSARSSAKPVESVPPLSSSEVTLFVFGWHSVEPGSLSWVFPSLRAALDAVQRMKNAIAWCIVQGSEWDDLDIARDYGAVLIEQR